MGVLSATRRVVAGPDGALAAAALLGLTAAFEASRYVEGDATTAVLTNLLATMPLALARWSALAAAAMITIGTLVISADHTAPYTVSGTIGQLAVLYLVSRRHRPWASAPFVIVLLVDAATPFSGEDPSPRSFLPVVLVVAAVVLGEAQRQRRQAITERDKALHTAAETMLEQTAMGERARIARELHDVVAHHLSMISVQAETARLTSPGLGDDGRERFETIGGTAREALTEMRRLLGVLREDADGGAERAPQPGLDRLGELVDAARDAGTNVRLVLRGPVVALPVGVDLTVYRIVQEALTNARRHAPGAQVEIELTYRADTVHLRVSDNGPGPAPAHDHPTGGGRRAAHSAGHGLLGMRERAAMLGGVLRAGPGDAGGFAVEADLPTRTPAP